MPWFHSPHASGLGLHAHRAPGRWPPFFRARRFLVRPDAGAIEKRHPELDPALLGQEQQPLPDTQVGPADEHLSRPRPGPQVRRDGPPLGPVLMPPEDDRDCTTEILGRGLALGPARLDQRLQPHPVRIRQHRPLLIPGGAKRPSSKSVQARTGPSLAVRKELVNEGRRSWPAEKIVLPSHLDQAYWMIAPAMSSTRQGFGTKGMWAGTSFGPT